MEGIMKSIFVAASRLKAQTGRMRVIAENIANADSVGATPGQDPYRRQVPTFASELDRELGSRVVTLERIVPDRSDFGLRFDPGHPAADERGYVKTPNLNVIQSTRQMLARTLDILRA